MTPAAPDAARAGRRLADRDLAAVLGAFPVAFVVYDRADGRIVQASEAALGLMGATQLVGRDVRTLMLDAPDDGGDGFPVAPIAPGRFHSADGRPMRRDDGAVTHVDCVVGAAVVDGRQLRMLAIRDVSERVEHERARDRAAHELMQHQLSFRREVAERLHDGPVQVLTAAALRLGLLRLTASPELADELAEIERLVSQSLRAVRGEMEDLRPPVADGGDLAEALDDLLARMGADDRYTVHCPDDPPPSVAQLFFNVVQHLVLDDLDAAPDGGAADVSITLGRRHAVLRVRTAGDGRLNARLTSWAMTVDGSLTRTTDGSGTTVQLTVPLPADAP